MALDSVRKDILESAEAQADEQMRVARDEAAAILAEADQTISEMREKEGKRLEEALERLRRQELSSAELESKKIVLARQKEILNRAFQESLSALEASNAATKKRHYAAMVKATEDFFDKPKIFCPLGEKDRLKELKAHSVSEDGSIAGGLILESQDGSMRVDMQYETVLRTIWDEKLKELSDILFG